MLELYGTILNPIYNTKEMSTVPTPLGTIVSSLY